MSEQRSRLAGPPRSPAEPRGCRSPSADRGSLRAERSGLQPCRRFVSFLLSQTRPREGAVPLPELRPKQQGQPSAGTRRLPGVPSDPVLRSMSSPPFGGSAGTWPGPGQGDSPELSSPPGSPGRLLCRSSESLRDGAAGTPPDGSAAGIKAREERRERVRTAGDGGSAAVGAEPCPPLHHRTPRLAPSASCPFGFCGFFSLIEVFSLPLVTRPGSLEGEALNRALSVCLISLSNSCKMWIALIVSTVQKIHQ